MSRDLNELHPDVKALAVALVDLAAREGIRLGITQTYRSIEEQDSIYAQGRTTPGAIVTNAQGGWSWHNWRRAFDVCILDYPGDPDPKDVYNGPWKKVGELGESLGLEWGGRWKHPDMPHFQLTRGQPTLAVLNSRPHDEGYA